MPERGGALLLNDRSPDDKDSLLWKWSKGALTTKAEFGDPLNATSYSLCLYDGVPKLIARATIPAGGVCAGRPCWTEKTLGFRYVDRDRTPDGIAKLMLSEGLTDGKTKIQMSGKGADLPMPAILGPTIALLPPVTVVLKNSAGVCWKARYSAPAITNAAGPPARFKDRAD